MPKPSAATDPVTFSDEAGTVATSLSTPSTSAEFKPDLGKLTAGILLFGLMGFALYWYKKTPKVQLPIGTLNTLGKIQLSPNQHVHLIGCGQEALLVGTSSSQITLLHQFPLQKLEQEKTESATVSVIEAPHYSTASSTLYNNSDFGILLQQQSLSTPAHQEAIKTL
ncbi:MAG: flagellar biosynthetic protein FliO [Rhodothermales bacterium]